jgi:hypothetical protein
VEYLTLSTTTHPNIPPGAIVDYPRLKRLSLCPRWLSFFHEDLSQVMTLPALRTLRLVSCKVAPLTAREAESISRFLADVAPAIETLHFNLRGEVLHPQILHFRAGISRLEFKDIEIAVDTIALLTTLYENGSSSNPSSSRWLMQHLSSISFEDCDFPREMEKTLAQLVEARAEVNHYIRLNVKLEKVSVRQNGVVTWKYPMTW